MINFVHMEFAYSYNTIDNFAKKIIPLLKYKLVFLEGELGSGKTTLIKQFCKELGFKLLYAVIDFPYTKIKIKNVDDISRIVTLNYNEF